jgi:hypothetical protein
MKEQFSDRQKQICGLLNELKEKEVQFDAEVFGQ